MQLYTYTNTKISLHLQSQVSKQLTIGEKAKLCFKHTSLYKFAVQAQQQPASDALGREIYEHIHLVRGAGVGLARYAAAKLGDNFDRANIFRPSLSTFVRVDI